MLSNGYLPHNVYITRNSIRSVNKYCSMYKTPLKENKKEQLKITGKNEKLRNLKNILLQWRTYTDKLQEVLLERGH